MRKGCKSIQTFVGCNPKLTCLNGQMRLYSKQLKKKLTKNLGGENVDVLRQKLKLDDVQDVDIENLENTSEPMNAVSISEDGIELEGKLDPSNTLAFGTNKFLYETMPTEFGDINIQVKDSEISRIYGKLHQGRESLFQSKRSLHAYEKLVNLRNQLAKKRSRNRKIANVYRQLNKFLNLIEGDGILIRKVADNDSLVQYTLTGPDSLPEKEVKNSEDEHLNEIIQLALEAEKEALQEILENSTLDEISKEYPSLSQEWNDVTKFGEYKRKFIDSGDKVSIEEVVNAEPSHIHKQFQKPRRDLSVDPTVFETKKIAEEKDPYTFIRDIYEIIEENANSPFDEQILEHLAQAEEELLPKLQQLFPSYDLSTLRVILTKIYEKLGIAKGISKETKEKLKVLVNEISNEGQDDSPIQYSLGEHLDGYQKRPEMQNVLLSIEKIALGKIGPRAMHKLWESAEKLEDKVERAVKFPNYNYSDHLKLFQQLLHPLGDIQPEEQSSESLSSTQVHLKGGMTFAVGRNKRAVATVQITPGTGLFTINGKCYSEYFHHREELVYLMRVFRAADAFGQINCKAIVKGGGRRGQAKALRLAIARGLFKINRSTKKPLKKYSMLRTDFRKKERMKPGQPGARKKHKWRRR